MEDRKICDYFVIAGLPSPSKRAKQTKHNQTNSQSPQHRKCDDQQENSLAPITDITIIRTNDGEEVPEGYECIEKTPTGYQADLNHGSINSPTIFMCYRRGTDKPPLTDIGVFYESKDDLMPDSCIVEKSYYGRCGNINNGNSKVYLTYRRSKPDAPCNQLVVIDICVILINKGETPPHAFNLIQKNLNKDFFQALTGSDVFICYKKSMNSPPLLRYTPSIIDRYPKNDLDCYQLPESIAMFCLPLGSTIECWPKENTKVLPLLSTFVLTSNSGAKVYGVALTFYENFQLDELDTLTNSELKKLGYFSGFEQLYKKLVVNKAICILSRWPFFELFEGFLNYLYKSVFRSFKKPLNLPIEVYISHFMMNIPFPSIQRPKIRIQLSQEEEDQLTLTNPFEETSLPLSGASYVNFLQTLGSENCMNVFLFALTEQKLLLHSLRLDVLTSVAEALTSLIFPFHWQCPYIPLTPLELCDVLKAPLPFILGFDSRFFDKSNFDNETPSDLICIDLDTQSIYMCETKRNLSIKLVPKKAYKNLKKSLENIELRLIAKMWEMRNMKPSISFSQLSKKLEKQFGIEIQETFLQFMTFILKDFRSYLMPIKKQPSIGSTDPNSLFDFKEFIESKEKNYHQFYTLLTNTQMFTRFIEERTFFSDKYTSLAFFDECLNRIESKENTDFSTFQLIELDDRDRNDSKTTQFISDPESIINTSNYSQVFKYNKFGPFNHNLFLKEPILCHSDLSYRKSSFESGPSLLSLGSNSNAKNRQRLSNTDLQESQDETSSPMMMKRTKHEVRSAQRIAKRLAGTPLTWSKCLISYCYSVWFVHLHSYVRANQNLSLKAKLKIAFNVLLRMQTLDLHPLDEVCYRILMLLTGVYNQPVLARKILQEMKEHKVVPNAITYCYYSKAVMDCEWKSDATDENLFWKKLRHLVQVTGYLKRQAKLTAERKIKEEKDLTISSFHYDTIDINKNAFINDLSTNILPTLDKHDSLFSRQHANKTTSSFREKKINKNRTLFNEELAQKSNHIVKCNTTNRFNCNLINHSSEAGLLINSQIYQSHAKDEIKILERKRHRSEEEHQDEFSRNLLKIKEKLMNLSSSSNLPPVNEMYLKKNFFKSQSLSTYKQTDVHTLNTFKNDLNECKTILEQHTRTPSTASSQIVDSNPDNLINLNSSSSSDLINHVHSDSNQRSSSKDSTIRRLSELSNTNSDEHISIYKNTNQQSITSLDHESSTSFSPIKDVIKNMNLFSDNKVTSTLRSSFRLAKNFSKNQFTGSSFFRTSLNRHKSSTGEPISEIQQKQIEDSASENGINDENLNNNNNNNNSNHEIKCNKTNHHMTESSTLPVSISSLVSNESENLKKSNSSIENESTISSTSGMTKSHSSTDFSLNWPSKFTSNKHLDYYLNSTYKLATNTMNRFSEIKSTLSSSNSSTPIKPQSDQQQTSNTTNQTNNNALFTNLGLNIANIASKVADALPANVGPFLSENYEYYLYDNTDSASTDSKQQQSESTVTDKFFETLEKQYKSSQDLLTIPVLLKIEITSCSRCYNCHAILYDEEIMGEWSPDDSNLNTTCRYCEKLFVPKLTIKVKYNSNFNSSSTKNENLNGSSNHCNDRITNADDISFKDYQKFSFAYLSPIVLRKELENVVENEGDFCLTNSQFTQDHDIIYWNLVWYFKRVNLPTHLAGLYLTQFLKEKPEIIDGQSIENLNLDFRNVYVVCLWDNEDLYEDCPKPLYYFWKSSFSKENEEPSSLVSALVTEKTDNPNKLIFNRLLDLINSNNLIDPIRVFISKRKTNKMFSKTKYVYSIYRDLLFLLFAACNDDPSKIDHITFDRIYRHAFDNLTDEETKLMRITDKPPSLKATFCRRSLKHLSLKVNP